MRFVGVPTPIFLLLFLASLLVLSYFLQSISQRNLHFSSNPPFVFLLFNIIIVAIIVGNHRPSFVEVDDIISFVYHSYELEEDGAGDAEDTKNGYDEDDDDNGSEGEIGWGDMDEYYYNLEKRIEDFIDKVNKGWREERVRDGVSYPLQITYL
ncbi:hypothetical protein C1H46_032751 [Malus baccata]|uniref:DUF4408 domain-containing protein n=1 Tax=Malus baccata TaxID=106549 RepID=A0A540L5S6_MALBA|nr:hypothetical protein C1H46_032751 [Malus baccata]